MVSSRIAAATGNKARHILNRGLDNKYYQDMILELVREYSPAGREDIDKLLMNKLPEILTEGQKKAKIHNLISELSGPLCVSFTISMPSSRSGQGDAHENMRFVEDTVSTTLKGRI